VLSEGDIAPPIRGALRRQRNARVSGPRKQTIEQRIAGNRHMLERPAVAAITQFA
jgi:hypothetical protein